MHDPFGIIFQILYYLLFWPFLLIAAVVGAVLFGPALLYELINDIAKNGFGEHPVLKIILLIVAIIGAIVLFAGMAESKGWNFKKGPPRFPSNKGGG
jgi:hypothetical protein